MTTKVIARGVAHIISVEERFRTTRGYKQGDETILEKESLGW